MVEGDAMVGSGNAEHAGIGMLLSCSQLEQPLHTMTISPLDPSVEGKINQQYAAFYNKNLANKPLVHQVPWTPAIRSLPAIPGGAPPLEVGKVRDIQLEHAPIRVFYPVGYTDGSNKLPALVWIHGGGMVLGSINEETSFCSRVSKAVGCVVIAVEYRLAPEHAYPAGHDDAWNAFMWIIKNGEQELGVDVSRLGLGGLSSGANLALCIAQRAGLEGFPIDHVVATVPVADNTANGETYESWETNKNGPGLPVGKMEWYRDQYLPNRADRADWRSSPLLAPDDVFSGGPSTYLISLAELDLLHSEGQAYADRLKRHGKEVQVTTYPGVPHACQAMDNVMDTSRELVRDICVFVKARIGVTTGEVDLGALYPEPIVA